MKIFVTGGSGFIGAEVVKYLIGKGAVVQNFDVVCPKDPTLRANWLQGDILDGAKLAEAISQFGPEIVIHLAAKADINRTDWASQASIHKGTENLLAAIKNTSTVKNLVNTSTQLVIGPAQKSTHAYDFKPYTIYGEAKAAAEKMLLDWDYPGFWLTVRPANIWGPMHPSFADAIWKYIRMGTYLHPSGEAILRSYGYVRNSAKQICELAFADPNSTHRQVFYVADKVMDSAEWVDAFSLALTGRKSRRVPKSVLMALGRMGDLAAKIKLPIPINSGRAYRLTNSYPVPIEPTFGLIGHPDISCEAGVNETVAWLKTL